MLQSQSRKKYRGIKMYIDKQLCWTFFVVRNFYRKSVKQFDCIVEKQKKGVRGVCAEQFRVFFAVKAQFDRIFRPVKISLKWLKIERKK